MSPMDDTVTVDLDTACRSLLTAANVDPVECSVGGAEIEFKRVVRDNVRKTRVSASVSISALSVRN